MKDYTVELRKFEQDRQELGNAEKLFDLPITVYPELLQMQKEISGMEQLYAIYADQKVWATKSLVLMKPDLSNEHLKGYHFHHLKVFSKLTN